MAPHFTTDRVSRTLHKSENMQEWEVGDQAVYTRTDQVVTVVAKHYEDAPDVYYTVKMPGGEERQTVNLKMMQEWEVGDQAVYTRTDQVVTVVAKHYEDAPDVYYTVKMPGGEHRQTNHLRKW